MDQCPASQKSQREQVYFPATEKKGVSTTGMLSESVFTEFIKNKLSCSGSIDVLCVMPVEFSCEMTSH